MDKNENSVWFCYKFLNFKFLCLLDYIVLFEYYLLDLLELFVFVVEFVNKIINLSVYKIYFFRRNDY